ncbi:platelet-activating factor acetylhydrolase isoform II [Diaminobutyricimonas aerilata]|uniref:Platelet-activating factor acetylhydrolase isoform II n=1 Tax=Diaminobutyricimonas aerilata TaxID=1162967 RepID=A0A2M9CI07_9MICO|nr:dienelactone hydrolase family protein [Diaminobutyricimonas aerilata]PJJ71556.1 platelet-activating factor acetylhydrolase isoform II [Diaminobutyricimonas aerilata]
MTIAVSVTVLALVVIAWTPTARKRFVVASSSAVVVIGLTVVLVAEPRWMLVPLALAGVLAVSTVAVRASERPTSRAGAVARGAAAWLTSLAAIASAVIAGGAAWALPALVLPDPSGKHTVGSTVIQWDTGVDEVLTAAPGDTRVLVAQLWYPTEADGPRRPYLESAVVSEAMADQAGLPGFLLDGVAHAETHAIEDAPRVEGPLPLVLFSPGLGGVRTQNSAWAEDLASHGYLVAALDHPYDSAAVVLEDGTVIRSALTTTGDDETDQRVADELAGIRADDLLATLDHLQSHLGIEVGAVAAAGHSIGGAAAILAASRDARVDAVIDIDGLPRGGTPTVPVLAIVAGGGAGSVESDARYERALSEVLASCGTRVVVPGTQHLSFTDAALFLPPLSSLIGSAGRTAGIEAANEETRRFLETTFDRASCPG